MTSARAAISATGAESDKGDHFYQQVDHLFISQRKSRSADPPAQKLRQCARSDNQMRIFNQPACQRGLRAKLNMLRRRRTARQPSSVRRSCGLISCPVGVISRGKRTPLLCRRKVVGNSAVIQPPVFKRGKPSGAHATVSGADAAHIPKRGRTVENGVFPVHRRRSPARSSHPRRG